MLQVYILSMLYLLLGSAMLLTEYYGSSLLFLIDVKNVFYRSKIAMTVIIPLGLVIFFLLLFLPMAPGPMILGDLIPALAVFALSIYYLAGKPGRQLKSAISKESTEESTDEIERILDQTVGLEGINDRFDKKSRFRRALGWCCLLCVFLHFLFPQLVLL